METWKNKSIGRSALSILGIGLVLALAPMLRAVAQPPAPLPSEMSIDPTSRSAANILDMDLDQLANTDVVVPSLDIEVTSVSKQESTVGRSPAAIFVITQEMIRRSGVTSVPEALRMAPGVEVARISSHSWAITARGFNNDRYANKLLVLIDGRTVYTPLFSGVYWDVQDLLLEDVERIEVIRGPGGTLWGANAVNGVINILTKTAKDTQGLLVTAGGGTEDSAITGIRYGGKIGDGLNWRVYGKFVERDGSFQIEGNHHHADSDLDSAHDDWRVGRGGFRLDWELDPCRRDVLTVQGDYYGGNEGNVRQIATRDAPDYEEFLNERVDLAGANVLTRWTHVINKESDLALQLYYDRAFRRNAIMQSDINTLDIDFQHRFPLARRHSVLWGTGYRQVHDNLVPFVFGIDFIPHQRTAHVFSMFVQDEITLVDERLFLTLGSKFEDNTYSNFEYQPSARVLYTPTPRQAVWAAVSRAVRTPARFDHDSRIAIFRMPFPAPHYWMIQGSPDFRAEDLMAYEIGYRAQPSDRFSCDMALFYNVYDNLRVNQPGALIGDILPFDQVNGMQGETYGVELAGSWRLSDCWRFSAAYTFMQMQLHADPSLSLLGTPGEDSEGSSPHNQVRLQSSWDLPRNLELDTIFRYVDELPTTQVPSYITMDVRLGWRPSRCFELAVVGQNLLDGQHTEFRMPEYGEQDLEIQRGIFAKAVWRR